MTRKNLVIVSFVVVVTFELFATYEWINHTPLRQADKTMTLAVGSCPGIVQAVSPACAIDASASACRTKYEKKRIEVTVGGVVHFVDDETKPVGCEPSPVDYHSRCFNQASHVQSQTVEPSSFQINYKIGGGEFCQNKRKMYLCVEENVSNIPDLLGILRKHCVGQESDEEECPATYPTVTQGC
jgi:hypothetical protein